MNRSALLAALVATSLFPLSAFAHGGGGHGGGGGGGHSGGGGHGGGGGGGHSAAAHVSSGHAAAHNAAAHSAAAHHDGHHDGHAAAQAAAQKAKQFAKDHPRRHEVNGRDRQQMAQIMQGLKSGKLTPAQAKQLMSNDRSIKQQERADVKANGGHLTKSQQRQFNGEENANRALMHADEHTVPKGAAVPVPKSSTPSSATPAVAGRPGNPIGAPGSRFAEHHPRRDEVNRREADQRGQIAQGLKSGKLTSAQAKQLSANDRSIKQQEHADVKANGGYLTKGEKRQFNSEENANRALLRADEHTTPAGTTTPAAKPASVSRPTPAVAGSPGNPIGAPGSRFAEHHPRRDEVNRREADQRGQIAQGLKSGKLTPTQAKQLSANDRSIKQQEHADVKANGGYLTKAEQRQFNGEENANRAQLRADEHPASP